MRSSKHDVEIDYDESLNQRFTIKKACYIGDAALTHATRHVFLQQVVYYFVDIFSVFCKGKRIENKVSNFQLLCN